MAKQKLTQKKKEQIAEHNRRSTERLIDNEVFSDIPISYAHNKFILYQYEKNNSKQTISFYERFFKKFDKFLASMSLDENASISWLTAEGFLLGFRSFMSDVGEQTVNSYLRGYRAFGNYCEESGLIDGFHCPIKEVEPPVKAVYSDKELSRLLVKPDITYFQGFRNYTIITLILSTGARANTLINIKIEDVDLENNRVIFNTTKAHKVASVPLQKKARIALEEYIAYWRVGGDIEPTDYLFCNEYGEQLTRGGLSSAIASYNIAHGVEKTGIHLLRHTFAKNWITSGGDIITLAKVLTHSELDMVKRYANLYEGDIQSKVEEHSVLSKIRTNSGQTIGTKKRNEE